MKNKLSSRNFKKQIIHYTKKKLSILTHFISIQLVTIKTRMIIFISLCLKRFLVQRYYLGWLAIVLFFFFFFFLFFAEPIGNSTS